MTDKITLGNIVSFQNDSTAASQYNANNATLTAALDNTLSRDGTGPNQMGSPLDMNSNRIINLPVPISTSEPTTLGYMNTVLAGGNAFSGLVTGVPVSAAMQPVVNASTTIAAQNLLGIPNPGQVLMRWVNGAWTVFKPDGTLLSTSGTVTSGLQEAINYSTTNGYSLDVLGPGTTAAGNSIVGGVIECTTQVTIPPMSNWNMRVSETLIDFPSSASMAGTACILLGTLTFCNIDFNCTIQAASNATHIVQIVHTSNSQPSNNPYVQNNKFHFRTIVAYGGAFTSVLNMSGVTFSFQNNYISSEGILSGGFSLFGVLVSDAVGGTSGFVQNVIDITLVVGSKQTEVEIGPAGNASGLLGANVWRFGGITPSESGMSSALTTNAVYDTYNIGSVSLNAGTCTLGIQAGAGSKHCQFYVGQQDINTGTPVSDSGTQNLWTVGGNTANIFTQIQGAKLFIQNLPTSNPGGTGQLWNSSGVLHVT